MRRGVWAWAALVLGVACGGGDTPPSVGEEDAGLPATPSGSPDAAAPETGPAVVDGGAGCGAGKSALCELGEACGAAADCKSAACAGGVCVAPDLCKNGAKDQDETDIDCGGAVCGKCDNGKSCKAGADCKIAECSVGLCQVATCTDGEKNGSETDVDCGGASCSPCDATKACVAATDCKSEICTGNVCQAPNCGDGKKNGTETGVDCGGTCTNCATAFPWGVDPDLMTSMAFLWSAPNPQQTGLDVAKLDRKRVAIVRGKVRDRDGKPLAEAEVAALDHPEYGTSKTLPDGTFSMAVNGGMPLTFNVTKGGMLGAQRSVDVPWQDLVFVDDTVLVGFDPVVTQVDFTAPTLHKASPQTDGDGTRQAALFFAKDTTATMTLPDDSTQPLSKIAVRATEYTVGATGVDAMPAPLPPTSKYTYATEFSVDEAVAAKAKRVTFSKPVYAYVDNFLQIPVGLRVPNGFYDRQKGAWVPEPDGRVIKIVSVTGGLADLDIKGTGAASAPDLAALGFTDDERKSLADGYAVGKELWRVPLQHFSDFNFSLVFPVDAVSPPPWLPIWDISPDECDTCPGSEIEAQTQALGESVGIVGTPLRLHYKSDRVTGRVASNTVHIPVTGPDPVPASVLKIYLKVSIAGRLFEYNNLQKTPGNTFTFTWDGNDAWGRRMQGPQYLTYKVGYEYSSGQGGNAAGGVPDGRPLFAAPTPAQVGGPGIYVERGRYTNILWREVKKEVQLGVFDAKTVGLGGFMLTGHHVMLPHAERIYMGDGRRRTSKPNQFDFLVRNLAGGAPSNSGFEDKRLGAESFNMMGAAHVVMPDGRLYWAGGPYVWREEDGFARRYGGTGTVGTTIADGTPAKSANLPNIGVVAPGHDGSLYLGFDNPNPFIAKITPDGTLKLVAGTGTSGSTGDFGPATAANIRRVRQIAVASDGTIYFRTDVEVRKILPDGMITTLASNVTGGQLAYDASTGLLYVDDANSSKIMRIDLSGRVTHYAGSNDPNGFEGDDGPAVTASLGYLTGMTIAPDGSLYVSTTRDHIRRIGPDGIIMAIAGYGTKNTTYDQPISAMPGRLGQVRNVRFAPDRRLYFIHGDSYRSMIARLETVLPGFTGATAYTVGNESGLGAYVFDLLGRHQKTVSASGVTLLTYGYDAAGRLASVTDRNGNVTTFERDAAGNLSAIVAPGGQKTTIAMTSDGYIASIANPAGEATSFTYAPGGLLTSMTDPMGGKHTYGFDADGRLASDEAPTGFKQSLSRTSFGGGHSVMLGNGGPKSAGFKLARDVVTGEKRENTTLTGAVATSDRPRGNTRTDTTPEGVKVTTTRDNDQRFGADSSYVSKIVVQNGSTTSTTTVSRTVNFTDPSDPFGIANVYDTVTVNGRAARALYDRPGKRVELLSPSARYVRTTTFDALERPTQVKDSSLAPVDITYDASGLLTKTTQAGMSLTLSYDTKKRLTGVVDSIGGVTSFLYNDADRIVKVTRPSGRVVNFEYDGNGRRTAVVAPSGARHEMSYSTDGALTSYVAPGGAKISLSYGPMLEPSGVTLADGRSVALGYDNSMRLTSSSCPEAAVQVSYVGTSELVAGITRTPTTGVAQSLSLTYEGTLPVGLSHAGTAQGTYTLTHDANGWVVGRSFDGAPATTFDYQADGLMTRMGPFTLRPEAPRGATEYVRVGSAAPVLEFGYNDPLGRESFRRLTLGGLRFSQSMSFDLLGRVAGRTVAVNGAPAAALTYAYDGNDQLVEVKDGAAVVESYQYDANGNRTSRSSYGVVETSTYSSDDRLLKRGALDYEYDGAGQLAKRGTDTFFYSTQGELLSATVGGVTVLYAYDGLRRRVARTDGSGTTQYLYSDMGVVPTHSRAPDGTLSEYFYDRSERLVAVVRAGQIYWVATDQVGTPRMVVDALGTVLMTANYDAWGVLQSGNPNDFPLPHGFAGGLRDPVTGLVRFGMRDYEPEAGRWTARDPILFAGGQTNLYAYADNKPVDHVDPAGLAGRGVPADIQAEFDEFLRYLNTGPEYGERLRAPSAIAGSLTNKLGAAGLGIWGWMPCISQAKALEDRLKKNMPGVAARTVADINSADPRGRENPVHAWVEVTKDGVTYTLDPFKGDAFSGTYQKIWTPPISTKEFWTGSFGRRHGF